MYYMKIPCQRDVQLSELEDCWMTTSWNKTTNILLGDVASFKGTVSRDGYYLKVYTFLSVLSVYAPMLFQVLHMEPNKLWRSNSIFNLCWTWNVSSSGWMDLLHGLCWSKRRNMAIIWQGLHQLWLKGMCQQEFGVEYQPHGLTWRFLVEDGVDAHLYKMNVPGVAHVDAAQVQALVPGLLLLSLQSRGRSFSQKIESANPARLS